MKKDFSAQQAAQLKKWHGDMLSGLENCAAQAAGFSSAAAQCVSSAAQRQTLELLGEMPVEELNKSRSGIKTKLMRDSGINSIADVYASSAQSLAAIHGIGDATAKAAKQIANEIYKKSAEGVKIRLSSDERTPESTALLRSVYRILYGAEHSKACASILSKEKRNISAAINDLAPALSGFKWLFTSSGKKQTAVKAYGYLDSMARGGYAEAALAAVNALNAVNRAADDEIWNDFSANSVKYFNLLEQMFPELFGGGDAVYGLPEDVAESVGRQELNLRGLNCTLRGYQEWGVKYIISQKKVLLGDEMGLGKTVQAIAAMVALRNTGATHFLVVCPASVITNWCREITAHSDLRAVKLHGSSKEGAFYDWLNGGGAAVTTYESTGSFVFDEACDFDMAVVDEAHYIKNPEAKRSENVKNICRFTDRILFLTGTAIENRVEEMINLIKLLNPAIAKEIGKMTYLSSAPQFREKIAPVYYRRKREEVLGELPELIESREWCVMGREEQRIYEKSVLDKKYSDARRVSWNIDDLSKSSKANRLLELAEQAEQEGRRVIVFSFFLDTIAKVRELLGEKCLEPINGSVSPQRRQEIIDEFDNSPEGTVLAAQIQAGGTGLNIQSASVVILCEPQFKPSIENQAISRAYRMGQTRNVLVYRLLCDETVDERIIDLLASKQAEFDAFADKSVAAENTAEIDSGSFSKLMDDEYRRIAEKNAEESPQS